MICPKCGRPVEEHAVICPGCDFILDTEFLGTDVLDEEKTLRPGRGGVDPAAFNLADAVILGDIDDTAQSFETSDSGFHVRESTGARLYVSGRSQALMAPDAIPAIIADGAGGVRLTPFEKHVLSYIDGERPVEQIRLVAGLDESEVKTALATLSDKGVVQVVGRALVDLAETPVASAAARAPRRRIRRAMNGALGALDDDADEALEAAFRTQTNLAPLSDLSDDDDGDSVFSSEQSSEFESDRPTNELASLASSTPSQTSPRRPPTTSFVPTSRTADAPSLNSDGFDEFGAASEFGATRRVDLGALASSMSEANDASLVDDDGDVFSIESSSAPQVLDHQLDALDGLDDDDLDLPGVGSTAIARLANSAFGASMNDAKKRSTRADKRPSAVIVRQEPKTAAYPSNVLSRILSDGDDAVSESDPFASLAGAPALPSEPRPPFMGRSSGIDESAMEADDFSGDEYSEDGEAFTPFVPPKARVPTAARARPPTDGNRDATDSLLSALGDDDDGNEGAPNRAPLSRIVPPSAVFAAPLVADDAAPVNGIANGVAVSAVKKDAPAAFEQDVIDDDVDLFDDDDDDAPTAIRPPQIAPLAPVGGTPRREFADDQVAAPHRSPETRPTSPMAIAPSVESEIGVPAAVASPLPSVSEADVAPSAPMSMVQSRGFDDASLEINDEPFEPTNVDVGAPASLRANAADVSIDIPNDDDDPFASSSDDGEVIESASEGDEPALSAVDDASASATPQRRPPPVSARRAPVADLDDDDDDDPALSGLIEGFADISVLHLRGRDESEAFASPMARGASEDGPSTGPYKGPMTSAVFTNDGPSTPLSADSEPPTTSLLAGRRQGSSKDAVRPKTAAVPIGGRSLRIGQADSEEHTALRDVPIGSDGEFRGASADEEDTLSAAARREEMAMRLKNLHRPRAGHPRDSSESTNLVDRGGRSLSDPSILPAPHDVAPSMGLSSSSEGQIGNDDDDDADDDAATVNLDREVIAQARQDAAARRGAPPTNVSAASTLHHESANTQVPRRQSNDDDDGSVEFVSDEHFIKGRPVAPVSAVLGLGALDASEMSAVDDSVLSELDPGDSGYEGSREYSDDDSGDAPMGSLEQERRAIEGSRPEYRIPESLIDESGADAPVVDDDPEATAYVNHPASHLISSEVGGASAAADSEWEGEGTANIEQMTRGESTGMDTRGESGAVPIRRRPAVVDESSNSDEDNPSDLRTRARRYFVQAIRDHDEGRDSRARMNAKLASVYDPHNEEYRAALEQWDNDGKRHVGTAGKPREVMLYEEAQRLEADDEIDAAIVLLREGIDINPNIAAFHNRLGVILALRKQLYAEASQSVRRAVELEPDNLHYKSNYGKIVSKAKMKGQLSGAT